MKIWKLALVMVGTVAGSPVASRGAQGAAQPAPDQNCAFVVQANADASAGTPNIQHDGSPLPGIPAPDISAGFGGIPRSAQPPLTATQRRILECTYHLAEANAEMPYTLFVPTSYDPDVPIALIVDLHGLNITPLQQILFDGTTDFAERYGFIVVAPMGFNLSGWWGSRPGNAVESAQMNPATGARYTTGELSEIDAMKVLGLIRESYNVDEDRVYLMGHSMGGSGTYHLGGKYNDVWAGVAPLAGAGGITSAEAAASFASVPVFLMHGEFDSIVSANGSRRSAMWLQEIGAQHLYVEVPGADHEFWIRRGAEHMEKVFHFFSVVSKGTNVGRITSDMLPPPANQGRGGAAPGTPGG
jgi:poly(3-hydroxybutyrate) depolymerase